MRSRDQHESMLERREAALVTCSGAMYMFGGRVRFPMPDHMRIAGSGRLGTNKVLLFKPHLAADDTDSWVECSIVQDGEWCFRRLTVMPQKVGHSCCPLQTHSCSCVVGACWGHPCFLNSCASDAIIFE